METPNHDEGWRYERFALLPELDWVGVTEIEFEGTSRYLHIEAGLLPSAVADSTTYAGLDWASLGEGCRARLKCTPAAEGEFSFFLGSCRHRGFGPWRSGDQVFQTMLDEHLRNDSAFLILCGDQVYCDHPIGNLLPVLPAVHANRPPESLGGYFGKYRNDFALPNFRKVLRTLPVYMIFDDHEIRDNWAGYKYRARGASGPHEKWPRDTLEWGLRSYLAYQGSHSPVVSPFSKRRLAELASEDDLASHRWWYRFDWGCAQFMVLDTRSDRTEPGPPDAVLLGEEQMAALKEFVCEDTGCYKFVVSPVPIAPDTGSSSLKHVDTWRAYPEQRRELLDFIVEKAPIIPVFLSGDLHLSRVVSIRSTEMPSLYVPCVMSSALNWFIFGVQERGGPLGHLTGHLEDGPLPSTIDELKLRPRQREGPYFVTNETEALLYNNFVHVSVSADRLKVRTIRGNAKKQAGTWSFEIPRVRLENK
ncbi:alkaline phosphatase D family protein [Thauera sinica]|uniref:Alkaline phosphatase D family protein n=1 Tax=Thauera sinica TaxID=2665146 RepID=A0ABW1AXG5_9RHOO|nr:alkaline phosphatase D family protein [Thauera sp. K11]